MSLYPSLEDMKCDQMIQAQNQLINQYVEQDYSNSSTPSAPSSTFYPSLGQYMGLELSQDVIEQNMPEYGALVLQNNSVTSYSGGSSGQLVAPLSGQTLGLQRAQVSHGIRQVIICKDKDNKVGLRVKEINKGIFVCLVVENSPAALAGIRFGDQILQIHDTDVAGFSTDQVHQIFKKSGPNNIKVVLRDRPFERTITLHKDSFGSVGFQFKNGKICNLVKDSSATRNGLLIDHHMLEVNGQNVVGMKDKLVSSIIEKTEGPVTITIIPSFIYDHMVKKMSGSLIKELMDHSIPTV